MLFEHRQFLIRERVAVLKLADTYDIVDPRSEAQIGIAKDEPPGWARVLRLLVKKQFLPTTVRVYEREGAPAVLSLEKPAAFLRVTVTLADEQGRTLGTLRSKILSLGGGFFVHDAQGNQVAEVKGDWKGWNFRLLDSAGRALGSVTKKWAGIGKELFTSADNYMISLDGASSGREQAALLLAAGLAIDLVFKER